MKLEPYYDNVIVRRLAEPPGIIVRIETKNPPCEGIVLAVGPEVELTKPSEIVIFGKHAAELLDEKSATGKKDLWIIRERDIWYRKEGEAIENDYR